MPKVSAEHMAARRAKILAGATRCFVRDGFHATSMQDVIDESGVSAGGLYRHFASKDEIVLAIAIANTREVVLLLDEMAGSQETTSIGAASASVLRLILKKHAKDDIAGLAILAWGEVLRDETLAREFKKMLRHMHSDLARTVEELQQRGDLPDQVKPEALARVFFAILPGFLLQLAVFGPAYVRDVPAAVEALWPAAS
jgi:AcrR family transcriptional regulator